MLPIRVEVGQMRTSEPLQLEPEGPANDPLLIGVVSSTLGLTQDHGTQVGPQLAVPLDRRPNGATGRGVLGGNGHRGEGGEREACHRAAVRHSNLHTSKVGRFILILKPVSDGTTK